MELQQRQIAPSLLLLGNLPLFSDTSVSCASVLFPLSKDEGSLPVHFFPDISYRPLAVAWPVHFSTSLWLILVCLSRPIFMHWFLSPFQLYLAKPGKTAHSLYLQKEVTVNICSAYGIPSLRCPQIMNHQVRDLPPPPRDVKNQDKKSRVKIGINTSNGGSEINQYHFSMARDA